VLDAHFQAPEALTAEANLQLARDSAAPGQGCASDIECARLNALRAIALDGNYMPAYNALASYYVARAKKSQMRAPMLSMALAVCRDATNPDLHPSYPPLRNTMGVVEWQLGRLGDAIAAFETAAREDPTAVEPVLNVGAAAIAIRDFAKAESAYRRATDLRPNDYAAHLGLALALRGGITDATYDQKIAATRAELETCKRIDPNRPDAYFNDGTLAIELELSARAGADKTAMLATIQRADSAFKKFLELANGKPEYDGAVKRARERIIDLQPSGFVVQ
jgi:tetratricopeptide (TPR) repeat protein